MFKPNTLFILGAGASAEASMPVGRVLAEQMGASGVFNFDAGRLVQGDRQLYSILRRKIPDVEQSNLRLHALRKISEGIYLASSIDNYIDTHSDDPLVAEMGKLQIAYHLLKAERGSLFRFSTRDPSPRLHLPLLSETWFDSFARILLEKHKRSDVGQLASNVSIISFNYDRTIEFYLIEAIRQLFKLSYAESHEIVSRFEIVHPYGHLGPLPRVLDQLEQGCVPFGMDVGYEEQVWTASEKLKTYSEQVEDAAVLNKIKSMVTKADQIIFLGFAFHPQNMEVLRLDGELDPKHVYATGLGVSDQEVAEVTRRIVGLYADDSHSEAHAANVSLHPGVTCAGLLNAHWRSLSAA